MAGLNLSLQPIDARLPHGPDVGSGPPPFLNERGSALLQGSQQGQLANMTLIDLDASWIAGEHGWHSRSASCCFAGGRLRGRVMLTFAAGGIVHREQALSPVAVA